MRKFLCPLGVCLFATIAVFVPLSSPRAQFSAQQTWCQGACVAGTANAITLNVKGVTSLADALGVPIRFVVGTDNTGATTVAVGGAAATAIKKLTITGPVAMANAELKAGNMVTVVYDGTQYIVESNGTPPQSQAVTGSATFSSPGTPTWTVPAGITSVKKVRIWSGGGGGGYGKTNGGGSGGAGGGYGEKNNIAVTPGAGLTVTVGSGGTGGIGGNGSAGGTSSFQGVSCTGGAGGQSATSSYGPLTTSVGTCSSTDFTVPGGVGSGGQTPIVAVGGAAFASSASQVTYGANSFPAAGGNFPGGAGGGGTNATGSGQENGGDGAGGLVIIDY